MNRASQNQKVLEHLQRAPLTSWEAITDYRITRISGRIYDLRKAGHNITTTIVNGNETRYAVYQLTQKGVDCLEGGSK